MLDGSIRYSRKMNCPDKSFYFRSTEIVAKELIGKKLVRNTSNTYSKTRVRLSGIIIETEAYGFRNDSASHAFNGLTPRNGIMFGEVGRAYVYLVYGNHYCINVSARSDKIGAGAVLIRGLYPIEGRMIMRRLRKSKQVIDLTSGPGKITQAMNINRAQNGMDLTNPKNDLHIEFGVELPSFDVIATTRIGISRAIDKLWRFDCKNRLEHN